MPADLELDAPVIDEIEVNEPTQDDPIEGEGAEDRPEGEATPEVAEAAGDGRKLPQWIRDLKESHPAAYKEAKGVFFGKDALDAKLKDFDLDGIKGWLEEKGGRESLESAFSELESKAVELDGINEAIANANPDLIKEIADLHPESFGKLAEATLNQWAQTHPDDYGRVMSGIMSSTLQSSGIPMFLERMALYLEAGKTPEVTGMIQKLQEWSGSFGQAAAKPASVQPKNDVVSQREQAVAQREQKMFNDSVRGRVNEFRNQAIETHLKDFIALAPDDSEKKEIAIERITKQLNDRLGEDKNYQRMMDGLYAKRDIEGLVRNGKSREVKAIEEIAHRVGSAVYGKLGPKAVAKPTAKPGQQLRKPVPAAPGRPKDKFAEIFASA